MVGVKLRSSLFESDTKRQAYTPRHKEFLVSPVNARQELSKFRRGAKQEVQIFLQRFRRRELSYAINENTRCCRTAGVHHGRTWFRRMRRPCG